MVFRQNSWTLICDTGFDGSDAMVTCRSFGFAHGTYVTGGVFGSVHAQIGITNVRCTGREKSFLSCPHDVSTSCKSGAYASVYCSDEPIIESGKFRHCNRHLETRRLVYQIQPGHLFQEDSCLFYNIQRVSLEETELTHRIMSSPVSYYLQQ